MALTPLPDETFHEPTRSHMCLRSSNPCSNDKTGRAAYPNTRNRHGLGRSTLSDLFQCPSHSQIIVATTIATIPESKRSADTRNAGYRKTTEARMLQCRTKHTPMRKALNPNPSMEVRLTTQSLLSSILRSDEIEVLADRWEELSESLPEPSLSKPCGAPRPQSSARALAPPLEAHPDRPV